MKRAKTLNLVQLAATLTATLIIAACGVTGPGPGAGQAVGTPPPPGTKIPISLTISGSGTIQETMHINACSASVNTASSFKFSNTTFVEASSTGQFVSGLVPVSGSGGGSGTSSCAYNPSGYGSGGSTTAILTTGDPSTLVILPAAAEQPVIAGLKSSGILIPTPETGAPAWSWVFSGPPLKATGSTQCKLPAGGVTGLATPGTGTSSCTVKAGSTYSGTFTLTQWPCLTPGGVIVAHGVQITCTGSGSIDLTVVATTATITPDMKVSPSSLNFPSTKVGTTGAAQTVTVTNLADATAPLLIAGVSIPGSTSSDYSITGISPPVVLQPGQSTTFQVAFSPQATGNQAANLAIATDATPSTYNVALQGSGS